ncbi:Nitric oxide reductase FlRd-NAD(+) reductase [Photobacterium marinum]|uniref:Nitric oxide reductase FlRd-NAD(+) reductase n=1 Tax=Photobacterium marinum TaxID=1056511 RepID=L8JC83_9GAMM|nr:NADH:flavorubredoxin reductase NorW [Photobacterium marinum]ELR66450.1 Nitric oxide reductase FlRd-NAD(+) reductase [Photobacterium marinum]
MTDPLIIIGSGFAAYQLVKTLRRKNSDIAIQVFTTDNGDEYNKPDLSHVFSRRQTANDLVSMTGEAFASHYQVELFANTRVEAIDAEAHSIIANGTSYRYAKLVLATGANAFVPKLKGNAVDKVITLNSLQEYRESQQHIAGSQRILIMGGGLIGVELAMDLASSGKQVRIVEPGEQLMASVMPDFVSTPLEKQLRNDGLQIDSRNYVTAINDADDELAVSTNNGTEYRADCIISAAGLLPNTALAKQIGANVNHGIVVDSQLRTSIKDIYALGDCAEINGKVMAFLQPIILSANTLASHLLTGAGELKVPAMMIKVKTPNYPVQSGGQFNAESKWQVTFSDQGVLAKAYNREQQLTGFVVTKENVNQAFPLFRELQTANSKS